jgi:hypothetical protein
MHHHYKRRVGNARDRRNVADEIKIELVIQRRIDGIRWGGHQQRVTVRGCSCDSLGPNIAASTRPVLYHELLAEPLPQHLADQARVEVGRSGSGIRDDDAHRPRRIGLRPSDPR